MSRVSMLSIKDAVKNEHHDFDNEEVLCICKQLIKAKKLIQKLRAEGVEAYEVSIGRTVTKRGTT